MTTSPDSLSSPRLRLLSSALVAQPHQSSDERATGGKARPSLCHVLFLLTPDDLWGVT